VQFEWDERKRRSNLKKHLLDFEDAEIVFAGTVITLPDDLKDYGEDRWFSLGLLDDLVVVISHTDRNDRIRIISMRKANRYEAEIYLTQIAGDKEAQVESEETEGDD
jgi:uncharacterized DUF497 family protein